MGTLRLVCDKCDSTSFNIKRDADTNTYECICEYCGEHIATISGYGINWVTEDKEDNTDGSNTTT